MGEERLGCVRERHDSYKTLVGHVAEQLTAEESRSIIWHVDAPPKLKDGSALDILEYLERQGKFNELNVVFLSKLLERIGRNDLMEKVNTYSQDYGRHYSLPSGAVQVPIIETSRSLSVGSHRHQVSAPVQILQQEEAAVATSLENAAQIGTPHSASYVNATNNSNSQKSLGIECNPGPAELSSVDMLPHLTPDSQTVSLGADPMVELPGLEGTESNWDQHSLSNSSSVYLNYNSHPSSRNTSQETMHMRPNLPRQQPSHSEMPHYRETGPYFKEGLPMEFSGSMNRLPPPYVSIPVAPPQPWYHHHHASYTNISQESQPYLMTHPHRSSFSQHYPMHGSMREVPLFTSNSQDSLSSHYRQQSFPYHNQPMRNVQYYTPPHDRRNTTESGSHYSRVPPKRHQSVSYPVDIKQVHRSRKLTLPIATSEQEQEPSEMPIRNGWINEGPIAAASNLKTEEPKTVAESIDHSKSKVNNSNPPEYDVSNIHSNITKHVDKIVDPSSEAKAEVVERKRANSLSDPKVRRAKNRLSYCSVDERHPRKEFQLLQSSSSMPRSASTGTTNSTGSANLLESTAALHGDAGVSVLSSCTLNSEDSHSRSRTSSLSGGRKSHRPRETFLGKLTQQFSKLVRPNKEIEWQVKRSKLNRLIYEHTDKFLTCPYKLELDGNMGASNPRLTLYVHPYGREEDSNENVTLEVGMDIISRPKGQRIDSRAKVEVNIKAGDKEKRIMFGERVVRESIRLNYFFIKGFISHQDLKQSHSEYIIITISASLINPVQQGQH